MLALQWKCFTISYFHRILDLFLLSDEVCVCWHHLSARTQGFPAEHCIIRIIRSVIHFTCQW